MKILFHENFLNKRGTSTALFDYAYYNQRVLGNESIIITNGNRPNDKDVVEKFKKEFSVLHYNDFSEVDQLVSDNNIDVFYAIKSGEIDGCISKETKNSIHSVFSSDLSQRHGNSYATVSEWLSSMSGNVIPYVPHMISLPYCITDYRKEWGISKKDIIIGRYGGIETFDIQFVKHSVYDILQKRNDIVFLFLNTDIFIDHPRVKFFQGTADPLVKTSFINTCDIMLHARSRGESFGLAVLEFACKGKHIITYGLSPEKNHLLYLGENCSVYNDKQQLDLILTNIERNNPYDTMYLNERFSPINVMNKFKEVFL